MTDLSFILGVCGVNWMKYFPAVYQFSLMHRFVWRLKFLLDDKVKKIKTVNGVVTLISVKI